MKEQVPLLKQVFDKDKFNQTIDSSFSELVDKPNPVFFDINLATVNDFFILYDKLFYNIPKEGETNSHEFLVKQSGNYINFIKDNDEIQALLEEINSLREENLQLRESNINLTIKNNS